MTTLATVGKRCRWSSLHAMAGLFALAGLTGQQAHAATEACASPMGRVVSAQGGVEVLRAGDMRWQPAPLGTPVCHRDTVRVLEHGRAAVAMNDDILVRLDHRSAVTFAGPDPKTPSLMELCRGALHFITRFPKRQRVITPFLNASVEGTEFSVSHGDKQDALAVMEGRVKAVNSPERDFPVCEQMPDAARSPGGGSALLTAGQSVAMVPGKAPAAPLLLARPADAVQWALYYPPVVDYRVEPGTAPWQSAWAQSSRAYREGNLAEALTAATRAAQEATDARFYVWRAGLLLQVGRVDEAERDIQQALRLRGADADANALQAIIAVVRDASGGPGDQGREKDRALRLAEDRALQLARNAVRLQPTSPAAHIAMSYALQAQFKIEAALASAREATKNDDSSGIAWARVAELEMSTGNLKAALAAAERAAAANPRLSRTQTILGFAHLTRIQTGKAKEAFATAIQLDSADPLPRLGTGLALIREGHTEGGRKEIEIAASLDPGNALVRSYLGKAYFEEKRDELAGTQFDLAKALDPRDPTPWFYEAIMFQGQQRAVAAVQSLEKAVELNDNRGVSRSRLLLDKDRAARGVSLGRSYSEVGLESPAIREASSSLALDPSDYSAHRLLADLYQTRNRHEFARGSELLQAQLMQPVNLTPSQPRLAFGNLALIPGAAGFRPNLYEHTSLFDRDRVQLLMSGQKGNLHTDSYEGVITALKGPVMFSAGHFHYDTKGFRENNDLKHNISTAFVQVDVAPNLSVQAEYRKRSTVSGDLRLHFDPNLSLPTTRTTVDHRAIRVGAAASLNDESKLLFSVIDARRNSREVIPDPLSLNVDATAKSNSRQYELAYATSAAPVRVFAGGRLHRSPTTTRIGLDFTPIFGVPCLPPPECEIVTVGTDKEKTGYIYATVELAKGLDVMLGVARYELELGNFQWNRWSPKLGMRLRPSSDTTLSLAAFESIKPFLAVNETIEPTQVVGVNQFFDDAILSKTRRVAAVLDHRLSGRHYIGASVSGRSVQAPGFDATFSFLQFRSADERLHEAYYAWLPTASTTVRLALQYEGHRKPGADALGDEPVRVNTWLLPVTAQHSFSGPFFAKLTVTNVWQRLDRLPESTAASGKDSFHLVDLGLGARLPQRRGFLRLEVRNVLNQKFSFHDIDFFSSDPTNPRFVPTRVILLSFAATL